MNDTTTRHGSTTLRSANAAALTLLGGTTDAAPDDYRPRHAKPLPAPTEYDDRLVVLASYAGLS